MVALALDSDSFYLLEPTSRRQNRLLDNLIRLELNITSKVYIFSSHRYCEAHIHIQIQRQPLRIRYIELHSMMMLPVSVFPTPVGPMIARTKGSDFLFDSHIEKAFTILCKPAAWPATLFSRLLVIKLQEQN